MTPVAAASKVATRQYRRLRGRLGRVGVVRNAYVLSVCVRQALGYRPARDNVRYEDAFAAQPDPYGYERSRLEQERYVLAVQMIDRARGDEQIGRALEIGCHEGAFTQFLSPRCRHVIATDNSRAVLFRASGRLSSSPHVNLQLWDLCLDPVPGTFDLILLMDVLEVIHRPWVLRAVRDKVVRSLAPGGLLLVTNSAWDDVLEKAWWGRLILRGGRHINDFVARHPALEVVEDHNRASHAVTLLRRVPDSPRS